MSDLPWYKFYPDEWLLGNIQYCSDAAQLLFINAVSLYWRNGCQLTVKELRKRCKYRAEKCQKCVKELLDDGLICVKDDNISIKFLDEQMSQRNNISIVNADNGRLGGIAKAKRPLSETEANGKHLELELDKELEGEEDNQSDLHAIDFFKNKNCYVPTDEEYWYVASYKLFTDDFLNLCIKRCTKERSRQGLKPRPCRSDLTLAITDERKKYKNNALRNPPTEEE